MARNLFHDVRSIGELEKIFASHPRKPLLPTLGSDAWKRVQHNPIAVALVAPLRERALAECGKPLPILTDKLYASFRATGLRLAFESVYFERRRQLGRAVASLLLNPPDDPQFARLTSSMLEKFTDIFEEVSWALPAHVNWHNDDVSGKEPMQIDLFCAETSNLMAEVIDLCGELIPPAQRERIRERLRTHVWENYVDRFDHFHWPKATHNWNAVCHQGVLGSALSQVDDAVLLARMFWLARQSLPLFLGGFAKDGGCSEGIGYWSYGFGWFTVLNEQLETRTDGEISLFEGDEHVRGIARFGPRMALAGGKVVNFSDNGATGTLSGPLLTYLGDRLQERDCSREGTRGYRHVTDEGIAMDAERCDVFYLGRLLLRCPMEIPSVEEVPNADCFLPGLAVLVAHGQDARGRVWDFAAKAGHNEEHHNHNDCAGFLLNVSGVRFAAEIGAPEYTKDFFGDKRYQNLAARSLGHSVPLINGCEQAAGASFTSRVVAHTLGKDAVDFEVDATAAYPPEARCRKFVRAFHFEKSGRLEVRDTFELDRNDSLEGALITIYPLDLEKDGARIRGGGVELIVRPMVGTRLERVEVHPYSDRRGEEAFIHRLVYKPEILSTSCSMAVEITNFA
jgi:hypothetical protein